MKKYKVWIKIGIKKVNILVPIELSWLLQNNGFSASSIFHLAPKNPPFTHL